MAILGGKRGIYLEPYKLRLRLGVLGTVEEHVRAQSEIGETSLNSA